MEQREKKKKKKKHSKAAYPKASGHQRDPGLERCSVRRRKEKMRL